MEHTESPVILGALHAASVPVFSEGTGEPFSFPFSQCWMMMPFYSAKKQFNESVS